MSQKAKAERFKALHAQENPLVIPNPYDRGTARLLEGLGFEALASSSAGYAYSMGTLDNRVGRDAMLRHVADIVEATSLPVNADLENGWGDAPGAVAETIRLGIAAGLAGGSIEDMTPDRSLYPLDAAKARIAAAAEAAHGGDVSFVLTARAENYVVGDRNLGAVIERLQAYQDAGADVLYAPGLTDIDEIAELVRSVDRPVNVLAGLPGHALTVDQLATLGVKRISTGSALAVAALDGFLKAAKEIRDQGSFTFASDDPPYGELTKLLG
ncbi:MAG: isocitrate lyase/phosphoenolpyruvate mutase family protein [Rhodobiaceae bacterium]|nr:isocitrate lyase/phosphoenolpyruvate mutase family protein [Rhodobiaceae bacterium]